MTLKFTKQFLTLLLVIFLTCFFPGVRLASAQSINSSQLIITVPTEYTQNSVGFSEYDLTPQERQKLQALRQSRNKDILSVLDSQQRQKLAYYLHHGRKFHEAIEGLELSSEQQNLINAVIDFTNLKYIELSFIKTRFLSKENNLYYVCIINNI